MRNRITPRHGTPRATTTGLSGRRRPRRLSAGLGALGLTLVAVGCGGDDDMGDESVATTAFASATTEAAETTDATVAVETVEVRMVNFSFDPSTITIPVGTTVVWTNDDGADHTSTSDDGTWDSGVIEPGDSFEFTFDEPGTYTYLCEIHPTQMQGTVVVEG